MLYSLNSDINCLFQSEMLFMLLDNVNTPGVPPAHNHNSTVAHSSPAGQLMFTQHTLPTLVIALTQVYVGLGDSSCFQKLKLSFKNSQHRVFSELFLLVDSVVVHHLDVVAKDEHN